MAISQRHAKIKVSCKAIALANLGSVRTWVKGLKQTAGVPRCIIPPWSLELVLSTLKKAPFEPIEQASLRAITFKAVFLVAVTSARRASEIHALSADTIRFHSTGVTLHMDPSFKPKVATAWH